MTGLAGSFGARTVTLGRAERVAFGAVVVVYLLLSLLVFNQIEEDAFIYFRLVDNLAHGFGLVFNRGAEPVEAGSSLLWICLLLLFRKTPLDFVITAKLLGLAAGCVSLWLIWCISRVHIRDPVLRLGPPLLTVGSTPFLTWSQRGLETPLFVLIVLWLVLCFTDPKKFRWWLLPGVLLLPARPEGFLFLLALLPVLGRDRHRWRAAVPSILIVAVAAVALLTARLLYFHDLAPSPFYVKLRTGGGWGVAQIGQYVSHSRLFVLGIPLVLVAWRRSFWTHQRIVLGGFILIATMWCALAKDYLPYVRHLVPAIPLGCVLLVVAAETLGAGAGSVRRVLVLAYIAVVFLGTLLFSRSSYDFGGSGENAVRQCFHAFAASPGAFARALASKLRSPTTAGLLDQIPGQVSTMGNNFQSRVGDFLHRNYPADSLVVYDQMGQTPYYAGCTMRFIDTLGLTDRTIGRFYFERRKRTDALLRLYDGIARAARPAFGGQNDEITEKKALNYVFDLNPDLILIHTLVVKADPAGIPARLSQDPRLTDGYERRYTLADFVEVYERKTAPRKQQLDVPPGLSVVSY